MNYTKNQAGEYVLAVGAPGSPARLQVERSNFTTALTNAQSDGYTHVAGKIDNNLWRVISISELLELGQWPLPTKGTDTTGEVVKKLSRYTLSKGALIAGYYPLNIGGAK